MPSPRETWRDLKAFLSRRSREQTIAAFLSIGVTLGIIGIFYLDSKTNTAPPPTLTFAESFPANRTDAEIKADQVVDQKAREERARAKQQQYQEIANTFGIE